MKTAVMAAAAVDSCQFLVDEIVKAINDVRDGLAVVGIYFIAKKSLSLTCSFCSLLGYHCLKWLKSSQNLRRRFGQWAVVTGSSEGIGQAYAHELASRGLNLILISKAEKGLQKTADEIIRLHGVRVLTVPVDFAATKDIYNKIKEAIVSKEIGILVNNVGVNYDCPQFFLDVPVQRIWQLIDVNIGATTILTHMILPQMVRRGRGAIVMMSSGASNKITPQLTGYCATQAYLNYFAQSLDYEYRSSGIFVQCLQPFYVATRMNHFSQALSKPSRLIPTAEVYAAHAITTLDVRRRTSGYWPHSVLAWLSSCVPDSVWMWGASRINNALRRQAYERIRRQSIKSSKSENATSAGAASPEAKTGFL